MVWPTFDSLLSFDFYTSSTRLIEWATTFVHSHFVICAQRFTQRWWWRIHRQRIKVKSSVNITHPNFIFRQKSFKAISSQWHFASLPLFEIIPVLALLMIVFNFNSTHIWVGRRCYFKCPQTRQPNTKCHWVKRSGVNTTPQLEFVKVKKHVHKRRKNKKRNKERESG